LAAGIALRRAGLDVEIFERSPQLKEIGAGLMIWPNGARALRSLGVELKHLEVKKVTLSNWHGRRLTDMPVETAYQRYGAGVSFVHRADLQAALAQSFGPAGLRLGTEVRGFVEHETQIEVALRDGTAAAGDLLVGADGLRSPVRRQLLGDGDPTYLGSTVWRGLTASEGIALPLGCGINWWGRGSEFLAFHLAGDVIYWAGVTKEPLGEESGPEGHKNDLLERFGGWAQPVPELIAANQKPPIQRQQK
jgi:2-polyprenyl-6-methoxyphenol hydroxylase-like FAD-dependent oxidoreductase